MVRDYRRSCSPLDCVIQKFMPVIPRAAQRDKTIARLHSARVNADVLDGRGGIALNDLGVAQPGNITDTHDGILVTES